MFNSSLVKRVLKSLIFEERVKKIIENVENYEKSLKIAANVYDVNRYTIQNKKKNKLSKSQIKRKSALLTENEKQSLLNFIDDYFKLEF
jgi:hypothetical protein